MKALMVIFMMSGAPAVTTTVVPSMEDCVVISQRIEKDFIRVDPSFSNVPNYKPGPGFIQVECYELKP